MPSRSSSRSRRRLSTSSNHSDKSIRSSSSVKSTHSERDSSSRLVKLDPAQEKTRKTVRRLLKAGYNEKDLMNMFGLSKDDLKMCKSSAPYENSKNQRSHPSSIQASFDGGAQTSNDDTLSVLSDQPRVSGSSRHQPRSTLSPRRHSIAVDIKALTRTPKAPRRTPVRRIKDLGRGIGELLAPFIGPIP
ncbi:hypothetical protein J8273_3103 [Carpediemonas membranifera]|uniref:Uncharacterized protein n=1 Tax=Carpediemonas membranifera TaxID=201153 RepID=A0A8J6E5B5_9EUKA|nr:hypothetical protein J8273_3103 [Carpediemonas membranifera]|eukprot:KAG9395527.1 hypothetical protein J8273_3103 [Carpediemonas membranifera]